LTRLLLRTAALAAVSAAAFASAGAPDARAATRVNPEEAVLRKIAQVRTSTWRLQRLMGRRPTRTSYSAQSSPKLAYQRWVLAVWRQRHARARRQFQRPPRKRAWLCIHRHERHPRMGWRTNTGNGYYGGLQMDIHFQRHYGLSLLRRKGTADNWTPLEQMWVAERAYRAGRGFYPWPNTARACGLI
jgi:Transglycosylase-like domain